MASPTAEGDDLPAAPETTLRLVWTVFHHLIAALGAGKAAAEREWAANWLWQAGAAGFGLVFAAAVLSDPVHNIIALVTAAVWVAVWAVCVGAVGVAVLHQLTKAEDEAAASIRLGPSLPLPATALPRRLEQEHKHSPERVLAERWKLPSPVVGVLGEGCGNCVEVSCLLTCPCPSQRRL